MCGFDVCFIVFLGRVAMQECSKGYYSLGFAVKCFICPAGSKCFAKNVSGVTLCYVVSTL
jgi:hypothetical protein